MRIFIALFFAAALPAAAQKVEVPHKLDFAGITLIIRDDARREIQKDVDALTASPRHYQIKAERAKMYFPIIEKIFKEEGLPDDFKYLVLQESALIPDAVSTSNAVGFWQFKDFTAAEMGLRIDRQVDERLNIAASSRAAARYIIKNNERYFNNWLYALQSYQMGAGGVMKSVKDTQANASRMEITGKTYWYVKKFLAHKIAYEGGVKGPPQKSVVVFENRGHNTLSRLAKETMVNEEELRELNKWAKAGVIPDDRTYVVLLPVEGSRPPEVPSTAVAENTVVTGARVTPGASTARARGKINGIHTVQAQRGDNVRSLTAYAQVDVPKFLKWNDLDKGDAIIPGQPYFLGPKRMKGSESFHKVSEGESLWSISQRYGIKLKRLKRYNRIDEDMDPSVGTMLYLASKRPKEDAVMARVVHPVEVDREETFNWGVTTDPAGEPIAAAPEGEKVNLPTRVEPEIKAVDSVKILPANKTASTLEDTAPEEEAPEEMHVPRPENNKHTVQAGETLYGIARMYNRSVMDIVSINGLSLQEGIKPGQVLKLSAEASEKSEASQPSGEAVSAQTIFHEVKTSDTLYSISRKYNVTIKEIMEWNEKKDFSLSVGEKLRILRSQ